MTAIVLAAGYGTRLLPFTERFPKALLPVLGKTLLEGVIENLARIAEVSSIMVVTNRRDHRIFRAWLEAYEASSARPAMVTLVDDDTETNEGRRGAIGDLSLAIDRHDVRQDVLLVAADKLLGFELAGLAEEARRRPGPVTVCIPVGSRDEIRGRHGCVVMDDDGRIESYEEKPHEPRSSIASLAMYALPADCLGSVRVYLEGGGSPDAPGHFFAWLAAQAAAWGWMASGPCADVGSVGDYVRLASSGPEEPVGAIIRERREAGRLPVDSYGDKVAGMLHWAAEHGALLTRVRVPVDRLEYSARVLSQIALPGPVTLTADARQLENADRSDDSFDASLVPLRALLAG